MVTAAGSITDANPYVRWRSSSARIAEAAATPSTASTVAWVFGRNDPGSTLASSTTPRPTTRRPVTPSSPGSGPAITSPTQSVGEQVPGWSDPGSSSAARPSIPTTETSVPLRDRERHEQHLHDRLADRHLVDQRSCRFDHGGHAFAAAGGDHRNDPRSGFEFGERLLQHPFFGCRTHERSEHRGEHRR